MLNDYWDEKYKPHSDGYGLWPVWLYQYSNKLPLGGSIECAYITWKSEQHRMTPKY